MMHTFHIEWHVVATHVWMDCCLVPSGHRLALVSSRTLTRLSTFVVCDRCGEAYRA